MGINDNLIFSLEKISKAFANNIEYSQGGGANISAKDKDIMIIKASGFTLSDMISKKGFIATNYKQISQMYLQEELFSEDYSRKKIKESIISINSNLKPSIEVGFHSFLSKYVIHLHPLYLNAILCLKDSKKILKELYLDYNYIVVNY
mgnify:FL=1